MTGQDARIDLDTLRERLRALGYLDAGVDRFLLAPAGADRGPVSLAWRISLRIGLLAALLLGPAAAAGVASRVPGLIAGPRDAVVITLYLAVIFGVAIALSAWAIALVARALARDTTPNVARRIGLAAGTLTGLACLAYLTLWWGTAAGSAWSSPGRTLIAVAAAVAISLLLGHAVTVSALALLARDGAWREVRAPMFSWRAMLGLGAAAFVGASAVLALASGRAETGVQPPPLVVVPTGLRVLVIGVDGWNPQAIDGRAPLELPAIDRLFRHRATGAEPPDTDPARVWTTIATGEPPERHGVTGLELRRVAGLEGSVARGYSTTARALATVTDLLRLTRPAPVTGTVRDRKMFWEVAADAGLDVAVVNWWATWPATNARGIVISDRAALRLERGGAQSAEIAPERLHEPLRARWPAIVRQADALAGALVSPVGGKVERDVLRRSARLDAEHALLAREPLLGTPDLLAVYLPGLDIVQHELLLEPGGTPPGPAALAARLDAVRRYYTFVDSLIGKLAEDLPERVTAILVTHPGRSREGRPSLALGGAGVSPRIAADDTFRLLDVAPTVLHLLGVPLSDEFGGRPLLDFFDEEIVRGHPVRRVASYGRYVAAPPPAEGAPLDKETLERLRSLGYIR